MEGGSDCFGKADLHVHTAVGDGLPELEELLEYVELHTDLDVIAITDHDEIEGGLRARELASQRGYRFEVVVGTEVTTLGGHLLALFVERPVPSLRSLAETVDAVHAQGGLCVIPHPLSWLTFSVGERALDALLARNGQRIAGIETVNGTVAGRVVEERVRELNRTRYHLAETGGSDAHFLEQVGVGYTVFPGRTAAELRAGLLAGATRGERANGKAAPVSYQDLARQQVRSLVLHPWKKVCRGVRSLREGDG